MNAVTIHYCYPTSDMAEKLKVPSMGGFYVQVGTLIISGAFETVFGAEGFCNNSGLSWVSHRFPKQLA